jgi:hypothetical protein
METALDGRVAVLTAMLVFAAPAAAVIVGGGGSKSKDCLVVFDVDANFPATDPTQVRCVDGDSSCDADGTINGICSLRVKVCANSTFSSACSASGVAQINVEHSFDTASDPKFDPDFLALRQTIDMDFTFPVTTADTCTDTVLFQLPIKGPLGNNHCGARKKKLKLESVSQPATGLVNDTDTLKLYCEPAPATLHGCDPQKLFASTFDRIQKQIFNQNCALSGCHDSQSMSGGLLLETGAAYDNLVNHMSANPLAIAAGWLRVDAPMLGMSGNLDTSFLYHKIEGDLPDINYGLRMPRNRPKLNSTLRDIIRHWIEAGAPPNLPNLWVPGTF